MNEYKIETYFYDQFKKNKQVPMHLSTLLTKIPWILVLLIALYFGKLYIEHQPQLLQEQWHYYINQQQFQNHHASNNHSALQLAHDGEGHYEPMQLLIKTRFDQQKNFLVDDLNHTHIDEIFQLKKHEIKHAIIKSNHPINFGKQEKVRLLQSTTVDDHFVIVSSNFFAYLLPAIRNLIILGIFFNQLDLFFPLIMITESTLMLAFLDNEKHYLFTFYKDIFNSNMDFFNVIRLNMFSSTERQLINGNPLLTQYGYSQSLFYNVSGEFTVALAFLMITIFIKAGATLLKFEKLRSMNAKLRGIWNGFLFCIMPKILTFSSFSIRQFTFSSFEGTFYPAIGIAFLLFYLAYFIQLLMHIRKINEKIEYIEESRNLIGLVSRLDYKHDFEFDCLQFSNLYYPVMNYLRLLIFFVPIGASFDFTYASFGGIIVSQLLYIMFSVSSSGFVKNRDSLVYPLCDFLFMILQLAHIAIGLAESVMHSQVSVIAQKVFFSLLLTIVILMLGSLAADITQIIKESCMRNGESEMELEDKQLKTTKFKRVFTKKPVEKKQETKTTFKTTVKTQKKGEVDFLIDQSVQENQSDIELALNYKRTLTHVKPKVRKVRQGKII